MCCTAAFLNETKVIFLINAYISQNHKITESHIETEFQLDQFEISHCAVLNEECPRIKETIYLHTLFYTCL